MNIAHLIDHTLLEPATSIASIEKLCKEASAYGFRAVCIPPLFVKKAKGFLTNGHVKVATVTGFPFGYSAVEAKLAEAVLAIVDGADEIDMVINIAALKNGDWQYLAKEIGIIVPVIKSNGKIIKVIFETGILNETEIRTCCDLYGAAGVNVIKTSTGFLATGATEKTIQLLRRHLSEAITVNASGGINNYDTAKKMLDAGASAISAEKGIGLVNEAMLVK